MAQRTRLELATPGVTGRYSNQLNYRCKKWWREQDSNLRVLKNTTAFPRRHIKPLCHLSLYMDGAVRLELTNFGVKFRQVYQFPYTPKKKRETGFEPAILLEIRCMPWPTGLSFLKVTPTQIKNGDLCWA